MKKGHKTIIILAIIIVIILVLLVLSFFYTRKCYDYSCFNSAVVNCEKASYLDESVEATWQYKILGMRDGKCEINVNLLMVKKGKTDAESLVGKEMICRLTRDEALSTLSKNQDIKPQSDINKCNGRLKEDMQEIMIKNLWGIIIKNLGSIKEEVNPI
jgi:flagellar basal body-associated protein FliL